MFGMAMYQHSWPSIPAENKGNIGGLEIFFLQHAGELYLYIKKKKGREPLQHTQGGKDTRARTHRIRDRNETKECRTRSFYGGCNVLEGTRT